RIGPAAAAQDAAVGGPLAERQGEAGGPIPAHGGIDGQLGAGDLLGAERRRGAGEVHVVERVVADLVPLLDEVSHLAVPPLAALALDALLAEEGVALAGGREHAEGAAALPLGMLGGE